MMEVNTNTAIGTATTRGAVSSDVSTGQQATQTTPTGSSKAAPAVQAQKPQDLLLNDRLQKAADEIQKYIPDPLPNTQLQIIQDKDTNLYVYKSIDRDTGETVRQFPAEQILKFLAFFREAKGLVVDSKV